LGVGFDANNPAIFDLGPEITTFTFATISRRIVLDTVLDVPTDTVVEVIFVVVILANTTFDVIFLGSIGHHLTVLQRVGDD
jgi:hypothetical protein